MKGGVVVAVHLEAVKVATPDFRGMEGVEVETVNSTHLISRRFDC